MKTKTLTLAAILFAGIALVSLGAQRIVLDVDAAVRMARENNLALQQARIDLGILGRGRETSWNRFLPSLNGGLSLTHAYPPASLASDPSPWDLSGTVSSNLSLSSASAYRLRAAALGYDAGLITLDRVDRQLERDVRKAFYSLLLKLENIRLLEQSLETARKRYEQVSTNYEYGLVSELDRLNAQVNLENLKPDLERARTDYQTASMELKQELGLERTRELVLDGAIETDVLSLDARELIRSHASLRLEVQALLRQLVILENDRKLAAADEFAPALSLSYSYRLLQSDPFSLAGWGASGWSGRSNLAISLSVPIDGAIPSSASRVRLADLDDRIRKTNLELIQVRQAGEIRIETLVLNLERSGLSIEVLKKNAELARRVYELTEREYEAGLTDLLTLEESYDGLQQSRLRVLTEQYNYVSLLLDLEYELNASLRH